jgi:hypothetical protein
MRLGEVKPSLLSFADAYNETVDVSAPDRPYAIYAEYNDLSSIDVAIAKPMEQVGRRELLVFDSLTFPCPSGGSGILKFTRQLLRVHMGDPIASGSSDRWRRKKIMLSQERVW